jgi:hypothetical protein
MERRIPTVFVATHGAYPYIIKNDKNHMQYKIIPEGMTVYILETAPFGVCNINTALDNNSIGNEIEEYMKYGMHKEVLIYKIVDFMDTAHKDYILVYKDLPAAKEDELLIHSLKEGKMYSLKKLVGGNFYYDKIFSRKNTDNQAYNEINYDYINDHEKNKYEMRINLMNLEINKGFKDIDNSTTFSVDDMLGPDMVKEIYLSSIIQRIYESGFRYVIIIDNSCSSLCNKGDKKLASKSHNELVSKENLDKLYKLYNDMQFVWLNTNILNEDDEKKRIRLLNTIHNLLNEEKPNEDDEKPNEHHEKKRRRLHNDRHHVFNEETPIKKQKKGGKRRKSKNHRRKRTNRKTNKKRLDR